MSLFKPRGRLCTEQAEALAARLDAAQAGIRVECGCVEIAAALRPAVVARETPREQNKARMLRAFDAEVRPGTDGAGSRDGENVGSLGVTEVHVAQVDLPDGSVIRLADVERITPERAREVAASLRTLRDVALRRP